MLRGLQGGARPPSLSRTCRPLRSGHDVLPQLPQRAVPRHLLIARQALRQLDLRRERHSWNHGEENPETTHSALPLGRSRDDTRRVTPYDTAATSH